jgi:hypothetical protein
MAAPTTAGTAALVLQAYRKAYGSKPSGASGVSGLQAPASTLLRAALMNTAAPDLYDARWILTTDTGTRLTCPPEADLFGLCSLGVFVVYSAASGDGTGHRELQGSWQIGAIAAGTSTSQRFVVHAAPAAGPATVGFVFAAGHPSDGSRALPSSWIAALPSASVSRGGDAIVTFSVSVPADAAPGIYTGRVVATVSNGQRLAVPVFAAVSLHDADPAAGAVGPQGSYASDRDVLGRWNTAWPSAAGTAPTGTGADWRVFPVDLAAGLGEARFSVYDPAGTDTYDLYLYDAHGDLAAATHPFLPGNAGATDVQADAARGATTQAQPQVLCVRTPAAGRHYLVVSRSKFLPPGTVTQQSVGEFRLGLDEIRAPAVVAPTQLAYEGDYVWRQGEAAKLAGRLEDGSGAAIAGRDLTFAVDGSSDLCGGPCVARTDYRGLGQAATAPVALAPGVHELTVSFGGDAFWQAGTDAAYVLVVGTGLPGGGTGGHVEAGGWFVPDGVSGGKNDVRVHLAFHADGSAAPSGELRYRDVAGGVDVTLVAFTALTVSGNAATLTGHGPPRGRGHVLLRPDGERRGRARARRGQGALPAPRRLRLRPVGHARRRERPGPHVGLIRPGREGLVGPARKPAPPRRRVACSRYEPAGRADRQSLRLAGHVPRARGGRARARGGR